MISRHVTTDLLLTLATHARQLARLHKVDTNENTVNEQCLEILNAWSKEIEAAQTTISLRSVLENAIRVQEQGDNATLQAIGSNLILQASNIDSFLGWQRAMNPIQLATLRALDEGLKDINKVSYNQAAAIIADVQNTTDAAIGLKKIGFWRWMSEQHKGSTISKFLEQVAEAEERSQKIEIPKLFAERLTNYYLSCKAYRS